MREDSFALSYNVMFRKSFKISRNDTYLTLLHFVPTDPKVIDGMECLYQLRKSNYCVKILKFL